MPRQAPAAKPAAGIHYRGDVNAKHEFHGHGVLTVADGKRYDGEFRNGKKHGHGTLILPGGARYEGEFCNDERHGHGTYTLADGQYYEGEFRNNARHGSGTQTWQSGQRYEGEFQDGKLEGYGIMTSVMDDKHVGEWRNGVPYGQVTCIYNSGHSVLSHWLGFHSFEGETCYNFGNGTYYTGHTKECFPHGQGMLVYGSDARYAGEWMHGKSGMHTIQIHRGKWLYYRAEENLKKRHSGDARDSEKSKKIRIV